MRPRHDACNYHDDVRSPEHQTFDPAVLKQMGSNDLVRDDRVRQSEGPTPVPLESLLHNLPLSLAATAGFGI